jgi:chromosome segregation ATPase
VRKGTMSTPAEALAKFWDELRTKARVEIDHADLPAEIKAVAAEAIAGLWRQATEAARGELASFRVELQADLERARHEQAQAQHAADQATGTAEHLRLELAAAIDAADQVRAELEAERRALAGSHARVEELQTQLAQSREQQQRMQEAFSADLTKAREAVDVADGRAAAAEKRALMEIEQERQARAKADRLSETLRGQMASAEVRERQAAVEHAEAITRLQAKQDAASISEKALQQSKQALEEELRASHARLLTAQEEATRYRAEAQTIQAVLDRLTVAAPPTKIARKKRASRDDS